MVATPAPVVQTERDHRFYLTMAVATIVVIGTGFAPTYYLRRAFDGAPLAPIVQWHALVMTLWLLLFLLQTSLIATGRAQAHRRIGAAGVILAVAIVILGFETMLFAGRDGFVGRSYPGSSLSFMSIGFFDILVFAILVGLGLCFRRVSGTHKRLMLLAMIALWPPGVSRLPLAPDGLPPGLFAAIAVSCVVMGCAIYDFARRGRLHPVYIWGGSLFIVSLPLRFVLGMTDTWVAFADWMINTLP
jgi:hypothetical protein